MSGTVQSGICGWFRTRAVARLLAKLCLAALIFNAMAPIVWGAVAVDGDAVASCHGAPPDRAAAPHLPQSSDDKAATPHCPLCVLFGGTAWAPTSDAPKLLAVETTAVAVAPAVAADELPPRPSTLRPSPRAPPAAV